MPPKIFFFSSVVLITFPLPAVRALVFASLIHPISSKWAQLSDSDPNLERILVTGVYVVLVSFEPELSLGVEGKLVSGVDWALTWLLPLLDFLGLMGMKLTSFLSIINGLGWSGVDWGISDGCLAGGESGGVWGSELLVEHVSVVRSEFIEDPDTDLLDDGAFDDVDEKDDIEPWDTELKENAEVLFLKGMDFMLNGSGLELVLRFGFEAFVGVGGSVGG
jgi:hypothetical protein